MYLCLYTNVIPCHTTQQQYGSAYELAGFELADGQFLFRQGTRELSVVARGTSPWWAELCIVVFDQCVHL